MNVVKDFKHVATPGRDPPRYQFPMLTQNCILCSVGVAVLSCLFSGAAMTVFKGF